MAEFSDEEYLRVLADNGDREAVKGTTFKKKRIKL